MAFSSIRPYLIIIPGKHFLSDPSHESFLIGLRVLQISQVLQFYEFYNFYSTLLPLLVVSRKIIFIPTYTQNMPQNTNKYLIYPQYYTN